MFDELDSSEGYIDSNTYRFILCVSLMHEASAIGKDTSNSSRSTSEDMTVGA